MQPQIVRELIPMSEAPMETPILAVRHGFVRFELITWPCCGEFIGFIPVPVYKPC